MEIERYLLDAVELVMNEDYIDDLDDAAFGEAVKSQAAYLAGLSCE